jgi:hypothetical protein
MPANENHELTELRVYMASLARASDLELVVQAAGWREGTAKNRAITIELQRRAKRREQRIAWVAIGVSVASLIVAMLTAWHSH